MALAGLLLLAAIPAYGFENPGLKQTLGVDAGGYEFVVDTVSNFDITAHEFDPDKKTLTFFISSTIRDNLSEVTIPSDLIGGNFTFYLDGEEIFPRVVGSPTASLVIVEFEGTGAHRLDIIGTTYLPEFSEIAVLVLASSMIGLVLLKRLKLPMLHPGPPNSS